MAELARIMIVTKKAGDLPVDHIVNTLFIERSGVAEALWLDFNEQEILDDVVNVFGALRQYVPEGYGLEGKLYHMDDVPTPGNPRPVRASAPWRAYNQAAGAAGPREVACCLSFRGERNIGRQRGRLFIGPWTQGIMNERPPAGARASLKAIAVGLGDVGGVDIDWVINSSRPLGDPQTHPVREAWVDDEWDTVKSRGLRATLRDVQAMDE